MVSFSSNKKVVLGIVIIASFLYLMFSISSFFAFPGHDTVCSLLEDCPHEKQLEFASTVIPLLASAAVVVGAVTYYLMSSRVESKDKSLRKNTDILLQFLNEDERKLVNILIENNGKALQAEVSRLPGMGKVKSHRTIQRLIDRGVIESETLGKTNIIKFTKEIKEGLL